jgi:hypothetical protein
MPLFENNSNILSKKVLNGEDDSDVLENVSTKSNSDNDIYIIKIEGPFVNSKTNPIKYVSRFHKYRYYVYFNRQLKQSELKSLKWAVSFDDNDSTNSFFLFSSGTLENGAVRVEIKISEGINSFRIYSYLGGVPNNKIYTEAFFKKTVALFIGGAGDKEAYAGTGPTNIIQLEVQNPFDSIITIQPQEQLNLNDYKSLYLGYNEAYKNKIASNIISELNKIAEPKGLSINIIGHSLGGWNGAHLSQILTRSKYKIEILITLDPVGTKEGVTLVSDIYRPYPYPIYKYWINIQSSPTQYEADDYIAWLGGQWEPDKEKPNNYIIVDYHHREASKMFTEKIAGNFDSSDILLAHIQSYLNAKI